MGHSIGDGIIVAAIAALAFGYLYLKFRTRVRRLELIHQERLVAMDKDFPLPEIPLDPPPAHKPPKVHAPPNPLILMSIGVVLVAFGAGTMIVLRFIPLDIDPNFWITPLPLVLIGLGLLLVHLLTTKRGA